MRHSSQASTDLIAKTAECWAEATNQLHSQSKHLLSDGARREVLGKLIEPGTTTLVSDEERLQEHGECLAHLALADELTVSGTWQEVVTLFSTLTTMTESANTSSLLSTSANRNCVPILLRNLSISVTRTLDAQDNSHEIKAPIEPVDAELSETDNRHHKWLHELRSPLQAALLTTELVLMDDLVQMDANDIRQELEDIRSSIKRSINMI